MRKEMSICECMAKENLSNRFQYAIHLIQSILVPHSLFIFFFLFFFEVLSFHPYILP